MSELYSPEAFSAFLQVIFIDLVLAGDNAIVIGLAASGLPAEQRNRAILVGIIAATVLRILFASITTWLLTIVGLLIAGGLLLLWVCWKMWRELRAAAAEAHAAQEALADADSRPIGRDRRRARRARPSPRPPGRSSSPTSRCRSTTFSRWPAPRASIRSF